MGKLIVCAEGIDVECVLREQRRKHPEQEISVSMCHTEEQLLTALELASVAPNAAEEQRFAIKTQNGIRIVAFSELSYCRCESHRYVAVLNNGEEIGSRSFRRAFPQVLAPLLESGAFIQCQASYIVNLQRIRSVGEKQLELHDGTKLPFPLSRQERVRKELGFAPRH